MTSISSVSNSSLSMNNTPVPATTTTGSDAAVEQIKSVHALQKAELSGKKVMIGDEQVIKNIERALKSIQGPDTMFEMSMHKETKTIVVKVLNKDTGELIREIPPEKTLDLVAKFMEINGILIDERV
ncbi:flagellar protein FlaG [Paenibacillus sp. OV219]|nr:flagellar protein FlaG [Paenibacillus sp. OV219]SEN64888.1 flagellar protein FlaG [Paenibacillus sp. OV219]